MKRSPAFTLLGNTCLLAILLSSACTKEKDPAPEVVTRPACKIITSTFSMDALTLNLITQHEYDAENRIIKSTTYFMGREHSVISYEHDQNGLVSKQTTKEYSYDPQSNISVRTLSYSFEYNQKGQVLKYQTIITSTNPAVTQGTYTSTCEYDSQGNRTKVTTTDTSGDANVNVFEYKDGNCIKATYRSGKATEVSFAYEYYLNRENKLKYYNQIYYGIFNASTSKNLIRTSIETVKSDPTYSNAIEHTYEYNAEGFPVKITAVSTSSKIRDTSTAITSNEFACQ